MGRRNKNVGSSWKASAPHHAPMLELDFEKHSPSPENKVGLGLSLQPQGTESWGPGQIDKGKDTGFGIRSSRVQF